MPHRPRRHPPLARFTRLNVAVEHDDRRAAPADDIAPAPGRDRLAHARDVAARIRDELADLRDRIAATRDARWSLAEPLPEHATREDLLRRLADERRRANQDRMLAADDRDASRQERLAAAEDRELAARDRLHAASDRGAAHRARV